MARGADRHRLPVSAIGALHGFFFAKIGVPAFVVTLAGFLGWNGLMLWVLGKTGTINLPPTAWSHSCTSYTSGRRGAYGLALVAVVAVRRRRCC